METFDKKRMKRIPGYNGYYAYKNGRIYRRKPNDENYRQLLEYRIPYSRYLSVYIYRNKIKEGVQVHKLVASAFRKINFREYEVFHKDKNLLNNNPVNLKIRKKSEADGDDENNYKNEIKDYEALLKNYINYDYDSKIWNDYKIVKLKRSTRMIYNWLKIFLFSRKLI
jgi:hypothetical protein